jgi:hypothetical protein
VELFLSCVYLWKLERSLTNLIKKIRNATFGVNPLSSFGDKIR